MTDAFGEAGAREDAAGARILIVDDEPANTTILDRLLRQAGYPQIAITNDSREALPLYEEFRPDVVLLDLQLRTGTGTDVIRAVRADPQLGNVRLAVLSNHVSPQMRSGCLELGADDYFDKVKELGALAARLDELAAEKLAG